MAVVEEIEQQRPGSSGSNSNDDSVDTIVDEFAPLLPDGTEPTLYRTISVSDLESMLCSD